MAEEEKQARYAKSTNTVDREQRAENGNSRLVAPETVSDNEELNQNGYVGVEPQYQVRANKVDQPLEADAEPEDEEESEAEETQSASTTTSSGQKAAKKADSTTTKSS